MSKLNVCVLFGGASSEHEVSLLSSTTVVKALDKDKYNIHMIGITKDGQWKYFDDEAENIVKFDENFSKYKKAIISPDRGDKGILVIDDNKIEKIAIDVAVPAMHGKNGEDGTMQGLFELAGIPYVGPGVIGSAICMDKGVAKIMFREADIPQSAWVEIKADSEGSFDETKLDEIENKLGYPCFVKPCNAGSSVGISKAKDRASLVEGLKAAFIHDRKVIVEEAVNAREIETSVMGNEEPVCAPVVGEIVATADFYDYDAKYKDESSKLIMPAELDEETVKKIREYAVKAYKICECKGLSRVDFFVDKDNGKIRLNEINTLPGFTSISMYPKLWEKSGLKIKNLLDKLIEYALKA